MFLIGPKGIVNNRLGSRQEEIPFKIVKRIILDVKWKTHVDAATHFISFINFVKFYSHFLAHFLKSETLLFSDPNF